VSESPHQLETTERDALLANARAGFERRAWADARAAFMAADALAPLGADDLERMAFASNLSGDDELMLKALERVHRACVQDGQELRAARAGFWLGFRLRPMGEHARSDAWFARVQRILDAYPGDCVERGFMLLPQALRQMTQGDFEGAEKSAIEAHAIATRFNDSDLLAFSCSMRGRILLRRADIAHGLSLLDEAMLAVTSREVTPVIAGLVYCHVISACTQIYALDRAREWTSALGEWCEAQPQLVMFQSTCLVHRAELMELGGEWSDSMAAAQSACLRPSPESAGAFYQQAEIHRLRGEHAQASAAYAVCTKHGREPLPGLALLCLAQGKHEAAANAMRRIVGATSGDLARTRYLPAHVEVMLAVNALDEARAACAELEDTAAKYGGEVLDAIAKHARAAVLLGEGNAQAAVEPLRSALLLWQRIGAPYIAARIHVLLARACEALCDREAAELELAAARDAFDELGAMHDLAQLDAFGSPKRPAASQSRGLTARELQVLRLVAAGKTNKAIARELFLSEKTVDRHVSNIFGKLDVPSRAAATAFAYEHGLI
jgi:DNA-binding CsgD family transcriptional regulator